MQEALFQAKLEISLACNHSEASPSLMYLTNWTPMLQSILVLDQMFLEGSTLEIFDQKLHFALGVLFCPTYLLPIVPSRSAAGKLYVVSGTSPR